MILLVCNEFSKQIGSLKLLESKVYKKLNKALYIVPLRIENKNCEDFYIDYISYFEYLFKEATVVLLHFQPTKKDLRDPYLLYLPIIYSLLSYHKTASSKLYIIPPFFYSNSTELKQIYSDKAKIGHFRMVPFNTLCSLPARNEQVEIMHQNVMCFLETIFKTH